MPASTNELVAKSRKLALPASLTALAVIGAALFVHQNNVPVAAETVSPLDNNSIAALTEMEEGFRTRCNFCGGDLGRCEKSKEICGACRAPNARALLSKLDPV